MARTVTDSNLGSRAAREKLKARGKPYYRSIDPGLHIGYRRLRGSAGRWTIRYYAGGQSYITETLATADDVSDPNGVDVLNFSQAQARARAWRDERSRTSAGQIGPLTVNDAMRDYLRFLEAERKTASDAWHQYEAFIMEPLGNIEVAALTAKKIRAWREDLAKSPPRLRTKKGEDQQYAKPGKDADSKRRRKSSANRTLTLLKAALNRAFREGDVVSDAEWRRVEPFENVNAARVRYLNVDEAKRLLNACAPDFRRLIQAALQTGCRYGELSRLQVHDFNRDNGTLQVLISKTGKPRHVSLTKEGRDFFRQICTGRAGGELMLPREDGLPWGKSHQDKRIGDACKRAHISPAINFHGLRHTWATLSLMGGTPQLVVARNLGHADTRMVEKHYGHLSQKYIAEQIDAHAPKFGFKPDAKVVGVRQ
jgi:integrase